MSGTLLIVEVQSSAADDPYAKTGFLATTGVHPWAWIWGRLEADS